MGSTDLRVLFLQGAGVRAGAERALIARLRHLGEAGIEPTVAFLADGPFRREVERTGAEAVLLGEAPQLRELTRVPAAVREVAALARARRTHVIEACGEKMSVLAGWASRLAGCASVYNLQDAPGRNRASSAALVAAALGRHDAVVVPSPWMAAAMRRRLAGTAIVIPNALVLEDLPAEPADLRGALGWPADAFVVGHFARLVAWKGGEVLLRAAGRLRDSHPSIRWLVAGGTLYGAEPEHAGRLRALAEELGVADRVHFAGHRDDALELMLGCDAVCHCSVLPEPFGLAVVEAMALGRPLVASSAGAPAGIVDHRSTGVLVPPRDDRALAAELAALAGNPDSRRALGDAARAAAETRFSSRAVAPALIDVYRRAAAERR
jgi:glycosyltransferase involved in cell wall biosynthesis